MLELEQCMHLARRKQILWGKWILFDLIDFAASQSSVWISSSSCIHIDLKCPVLRAMAPFVDSFETIMKMLVNFYLRTTT